MPQSCSITWVTKTIWRKNNKDRPKIFKCANDCSNINRALDVGLFIDRFASESKSPTITDLIWLGIIRISRLILVNRFFQL